MTSSKSCWVCAILVFIHPAWADDSQERSELPSRLRRPAALALSTDEQFLYAANRCGTVSIIDVQRQATVAEFAIGEQLSDITAAGEGRYLVTDEKEHTLIVLAAQGAELQVLARLAVSPYPVSVSFDSERQRAQVASLWSRRLTRLAVPTSGESVNSPAEPEVVDLQIAPRTQVLSPDKQHLYLADSFGGQVAIIDLQTFHVHSLRKIPGHNIRGLACTPNAQMLVVVHQMLNDLARTERNDVHWGLLMSNDVRWLKLSTLLSGEDLYMGAHMHPLGEASNATADPAGLAMTANGIAVVSLGGVDEIAIGKEHDFSFYRIPVGRRPTDIVTTADSRWAFVANTFGDSVTRIDLEQRTAAGEISLGPQPELSLVERGELLFYDGDLSHDNWMSCHSCHTDGHSNGGLNDNLSDGSFGGAKRVLSLLGAADTQPFAWNGSVPDLPAQLLNSTQHTMQKDNSLSASDSAALVAYLQSLAPPPSLDQLRGTLNGEAVARGAAHFRQRGCVDCHEPPLYTTPAIYDVGLEDELGNREFNPPSLRGVSQRGPYFHDNRAATLEAVFRTHQHQLRQPISDAELVDLIAFLRSL